MVWSLFADRANYAHESILEDQPFSGDASIDKKKFTWKKFESTETTHAWRVRLLSANLAFADRFAQVKGWLEIVGRK